MSYINMYRHKRNSKKRKKKEKRLPSSYFEMTDKISLSDFILLYLTVYIMTCYFKNLNNEIRYSPRDILFTITYTCERKY